MGTEAPSQPILSSRSSQNTLQADDMSSSVPNHEKPVDTSTPHTGSQNQTSTAAVTNGASEKSDIESPPTQPQKPSGMQAGIPPPPNGGLVAWLQVVAGFMLFFNTWGILNTFGVYQTYYETGALFTETSSNISWIGSIQAYMVLTVGFFSGPVYDRGYLRALLIAGSFGVVFGHMMLSLCTEFWQVLLAQGFCVGMGAGCLFVPAVAILPTYFNTKIGLAIGLAAAGSSMGGVIYPIAFYKLIGEVGFGWATRIIGFIALATLLVPIFVMKMRFKPPKARNLVDLSAFTDPPFMVFTIGTMIGFIGLYVMFFYLSYFAGERHITNAAMSFYIVPIFNAASTFGRTLPNALSDKTGPLNLIVPGAIVVGILTLCMLAVTSEAGIIVIAVLFGFFSGVFIALPPVCFVALTQDKRLIGTRIGMGFGIFGFGVLCGGPAAGSILGADEGNLNWTGLWVYAGVTLLASGVIFAALRVWKAGTALKVKI
ncbi:hypothetical protein H2198_000446 [Neophaeococcomyces mojaviensis]|uniref:Uncharacterized protein n=1 Tax=Neophaeococcomyces mojaviensis TaxID=3383035 RepID=A0ACC3AKI5_9EURO|nr:hypothetical protein H2198_000446 [Knufia sp. JES_112]